MSIDVVHQPESQRFIALVDGSECRLDYRLFDEVMTITHTWVPSTVGGRGIAAELTRVAVITAREMGWRVEAECSYAQRWMQRHPEQL